MKRAWTVAAAAALVLLAPGRAHAAPSLEIVLENPAYATLAVDLSDVAYGVAVGGPSSEVWRSGDEGRTWSRAGSLPGAPRLYYLTPLADGTLLAAADTGSWTIFRSDDHGTTWSGVLALPTSPCFYSTLGPHSIAQQPDGDVYLVTYNTCPDSAVTTNYVYRSTDDGQSWSVVHTTDERRHAHAIQVDPATGDLYALYGDSRGAIERSSDDGATWETICSGSPECVLVDIAFGSGIAVFGTDEPYGQSFIERLDLSTLQQTRVAPIAWPSYSSFALGGGRFLVGTTHESGMDLKDGLLHLYASDDGSASFGDVYAAPIPSVGGAYRLQVQYAYSNGDFPIFVSGRGTVVARLAGGAAVQPTPPAVVTPPTVAGTAQQGSTLTGQQGTWSGSPTPTLSSQWRRCDTAGDACAPIAGATGSTYLLGAADVGHTIRLAVTGTNAAGSATAVSAPTSTVTAAPPAQTAPVATAPPSVSGTPEEGSTLTGTQGTWTGSPTPTLSSEWRRCDTAGNACAPIAGATGTTYLLGAADVGHTIRLAVTGTNAAGSATAVSAPTAVVTAKEPAGGGGGGGVLGNTVPGALSRSPGEGYKFGSIFTASGDGTATAFHVYVRGGGETQRLRAAVYAADGGVPGTLLAAGGEITIPAGQPAGWMTATLPETPLAQGHQYLLALLSGPESNGAWIYAAGETGAGHFNPNPYSTPSASWGADNVEGYRWSMYVDVAGGPPPPPPPPPPGGGSGTLGNTQPGTLSLSPGEGYKFGSIFEATADGTATAFHVYARGGGDTQRLSAALYAADGGVPGALLAAGGELTIPAGQAAGWVAASLPPTRLAAGHRYLLALFSGPESNGAWIYALPETGAGHFNANPYGSPSATWGADYVEGYRWSVYVDYAAG